MNWKFGRRYNYVLVLKFVCRRRYTQVLYYCAVNSGCAKLRQSSALHCTASLLLPCTNSCTACLLKTIAVRPFSTDLESFLRTQLKLLPYNWYCTTELDWQFSTENSAVLKAVGTFIPGTDWFLNSDVSLFHCLELSNHHYKANIDELKVELQLIQRMIQTKEAEGTMTEFEKEKNKLLAFAVFVIQYRNAYYELSRLLHIACKGCNICWM